jgi:DNA-binding IclR family transcriptional regulator
LPLLSSASGRVFLAFLPRRITAARLQLEVERALEAGTRWPDLDSTPESIDRLVERIRADRAARVDGRFIPGLKAISCPITNWQGDAEVAVTLIGLTDDILADNSPAQRQLADFTARFSIPRPGR